MTLFGQVVQARSELAGTDGCRCNTIPGPVLKNRCKVPAGYMGETCQILQSVVGIGAHAKNYVVAEVGGVDEVDELVGCVVERRIGSLMQFAILWVIVESLEPLTVY